MENKRLDKTSETVLFIVGTLGIIAAGIGLISAVDKFNWGMCIMYMLYFLCYFWIVYYILNTSFTSKQMFISVIITFSISVILRDLVFPAEGLPRGIEAVAGLLSVSEVASLIILNSGWKRVRSVKSILVYFVIADAVVSGIWTWNYLTGMPSSLGAAYVVIAYWARTLLAACLVLCYLARMSVKAKEAVTPMKSDNE